MGLEGGGGAATMDPVTHTTAESFTLAYSIMDSSRVSTFFTVSLTTFLAPVLTATFSPSSSLEEPSTSPSLPWGILPLLGRLQF